MQYYARAYKKDNCDNNIIRMEEYMKSHLYSPMQKVCKKLLQKFNIRKKCEAKLGDDLWQVLLKDMRGLHYSISTEEYGEKTRTFKHYWVKINKDVYTCCESWFFGRHSAWQIFHNPPGYASTNSNIESFNSI